MGKPATLKTKQTEASVEDFLRTVVGEEKRNDCFTLLKLMEQATGEVPKMWGASLVGFGAVRYKSPASGREVDWFKIGFSPRKADLSLHLLGALGGNLEIVQRLGPYKTGVGCLYIKNLKDIDIQVLEELLKRAARGNNQ